MRVSELQLLFQKGEEMRKNQKAIIDRLTNGEGLDEVREQLLEENAELKARVKILEGDIAQYKLLTGDIETKEF